MSEAAQQASTSTETRIRWALTSSGHDYVGLRNVGQDPALDVEVDFIVRWQGQRDQAAETRRADLVPEGEAVWHNRTPIPHGTDPSVPREVMWEVRWTHPYDGPQSLRMDDPVDL